jgi:hypothetical protein
MPRRVQGPDGVIREFPDDATDAEVSAVLEKATPKPARSLLSPSTIDDFPVVKMAKGAWNVLSEIPRAAVTLAMDLPPGMDADGTIHAPLERTLTGLVKAHANTASQAVGAYKGGDYITAARKAMNAAVPLVGPALDASDDKIMRGDIAEGIGEVGTNVLLTALGAQKPAPATVAAKGPRMAGPANAVEAAAVDFAKSEGIPLDAATATGSSFLRKLQKKVESSYGGSGTADDLRTSQAANLQRVGEEQAAKAGPNATNPVAAGERVRKVLTKQIEDLHAKAETHYGALRSIEEAQRQALPTDPSTLATMDVTARTPLAVDLTAAMKDLLPLYTDLKRQAELNIPMQGAKGRTLAALDGLMNGPNVASLSTVDAALSDLKAMARGAEMPELRTSGQATAAQAVQKLDAQVRAAAMKAGPNVLKALENGRSAIKQKYVVADVLDLLSAEPGQVYRQLTQAKDVGLERLRAVQKLAPNEMKNVGRAFLEDAIDQATAEGGFLHSDRLWANWQKLGGETKKLLFQPDQIKDLDNFFMAAKKINENANPSGTATIPKLNMSEALAGIPAWALSKMLMTENGVKWLTTARMVSKSPSQAARAMAAANLTKAAQSAGVPLEVIPAFAAGQTTAQSPQSGTRK